MASRFVLGGGQMKKLYNSFKTAFAMFSRIPMPQADWDEENMRYMLCFFPWIGIVIGILTILLTNLMTNAGFNDTFSGAASALFVILITGGIHADGFIDTCDALSSWQERERRLEILKDPHVGAFGVIGACAAAVLFASSFSQIVRDSGSVRIMAAGYVLSRSLSGIGLLTLPKANKSGTLAAFSRSADERRVMIVLILYVGGIFAAMIAVHPVKGAAAFIAAIVAFLYYRRMALKYFGGTTGDLAGWFVCVCEVMQCFVLAVVTVLVH